QRWAVGRGSEIDSLAKVAWMIVVVIQECLLKQVPGLFGRDTRFGTAQDSHPVPVCVCEGFGTEHHVGNPGIDLESRFDAGKSALGYADDLQTPGILDPHGRCRRRIGQIELLAKNVGTSAHAYPKLIADHGYGALARMPVILGGEQPSECRF